MEEKNNSPELSKAMAKEIRKLFLICGIVLLCVIVGIIAHSIGYADGIAHVLGTCFQYPFLLIDSSRYMACPINP